jgi:hypothetical protein
VWSGFGVDVAGDGGVLEVGAELAGEARPFGIVPAAGGLRAVVAAAGRGEVAAAGRPVVRVWHSMFAVAGVGRAEAERERADQVAQLGLEPEPSGGLVGADVEMLGKVEDRLDRDLGVGVAAPDPHLFGGDRAGGLVDAGESARSEDGGILEVDVQHHLTPLTPTGLVVGGGAEVEGLLVAGEVAGRDRAAHVEGLGGAEQQLLVGIGGQGGVEVDRISQVEVALVARSRRC